MTSMDGLKLAYQRQKNVRTLYMEVWAVFLSPTTLWPGYLQFHHKTNYFFSKLLAIAPFVMYFIRTIAVKVARAGSSVGRAVD